VWTWRNRTGKTLSSPEWLEAHHRAKLPERSRFAQSLARYRPTRLVDLGCGTGLWLDLLDKHLPSTCEFVGVDGDATSLELASERARAWTRRAEFVLCDIAAEPHRIPRADLMLAFNLFPYLPDVASLLSQLYDDRTAERIVVRQWDGDTMRIGPMSTEDRFAIDSSMRAALEGSASFDHYGIDRTYELLRGAGFEIERLDFDFMQRHAPFPTSFEDYFRGTLAWMREHLSDDARQRLNRALDEADGSLYFAQVELVAVVSAPGR
jgi:SAM-dependent methyltransferase